MFPAPYTLHPKPQMARCITKPSMLWSNAHLPAQSLSIWSPQFGEAWLFFAAELTHLYHTPCMITQEESADSSEEELDLLVRNGLERRMVLHRGKTAYPPPQGLVCPSHPVTNTRRVLCKPQPILNAL